MDLGKQGEDRDGRISLSATAMEIKRLWSDGGVLLSAAMCRQEIEFRNRVSLTLG